MCSPGLVLFVPCWCASEDDALDWHFFFVADRSLMFDMVVTLFSELPFPFFLSGGGFFFSLGSSSSLLWHGGCFLFLPFFAGLSSSSVGGAVRIYIFIFIYIVCVLFGTYSVFWVIATVILVFITKRFFPDGLFEKLVILLLLHSVSMMLNKCFFSCYGLASFLLWNTKL